MSTNTIKQQQSPKSCPHVYHSQTSEDQRSSLKEAREKKDLTYRAVKRRITLDLPLETGKQADSGGKYLKC